MQHSATRRWTNRITALLLLMLTAMPFTQTKASHFVGVDMTSECLNACTVRVHLRAYRDCTGASSISNTITFTSTTPGCVAPTALTSWSPQVTTEVTPICPSTQTQCTNAAATINGVQEYYWFRDYDICASPNCDYDISWGSCCRNGIITSGAGNQGFAINTYVNYTLGCNNSPVFTDVPLFYACANQQYVIHQGAFDPDGDSLAFSIQNCYTNVSNNSVTYNAGYSPTTPLGPSWDVQVNPQNGMMTLTPMPGNVVVGVICFNVDEYRNGVLMGTTVRDMQVVVVPCAANVIPDYTAYSNLSAGASIIGQDSFLVCPNNQICFDLTGFDPDTLTGQSLTMAWSQNIPGATFVDQNNAANQDTITGNSPDGRFCWTPTTAGVYQFLINLDDNACPIFGQHDKVVTIVVGGNTPAALITATGTLNSCNGENDTLCVAPGWTSYLWSTAATTSCINVSTPGVYGVTVTGPGGCGLMDQVTVVDNPVPQISGFAYDHLAAPLASQKIYLIDHDTSNHSLAAVDSTVTDSAGYFEFCTVSIDTAYVKAAPDSALYPMDMPTYSDTAIVWNNALAFPASGFPTSVVINCQFGSNPGGPWLYRRPDQCWCKQNQWPRRSRPKSAGDSVQQYPWACHRLYRYRHQRLFLLR